MTTPIPERAFAQGFDARRRLETRATCPYGEDVSESEVRDAFTAWHDGWDHAERDNPRLAAPRYSKAADCVSVAMIRASARA